MLTCFACGKSSESPRCPKCNTLLDPPPTIWYSPESRHDMLKIYAMAAYFFCIPAFFFTFTWMLSRDADNRSQKLFSSSLQLGLILAALVGAFVSRLGGWKKIHPYIAVTADGVLVNKTGHRRKFELIKWSDIRRWRKQPAGGWTCISATLARLGVGLTPEDTKSFEQAVEAHVTSGPTTSNAANALVPSGTE